MKKKLYLAILLISIFIYNIDVYAASGTVSISSTSIFVGESFTVTARVNNAAAWNVHVSASGPVSGCTINQADTTADAKDTSKTFTTTCTSTGEGTINIVLSGDVTSSSDGDAITLSDRKTVTVKKKAAQPSPSPSPSPSPNPTKPTNPSTDNKSTNNKLKEISVEGHNLTKVDSNNYTLIVTNDITNIQVNATAEDQKAKVTGTGKHELKVGENNIVVVVTSESLAENRINIKVTRKDGFYVEDIESLLKGQNKDINITIKEDTKLSKDIIAKIKESGKTVRLNYYDKDNKLVYSWVIDGTKINNSNDLLTTITKDIKNKEAISKLSNNADGVYANIVQTETLTDGLKVKIYVGDKYDNNSLLNVYSYNKNSDSLESRGKSLKVENGYIEYEIKSSSTEYLITTENIQTEGEEEVYQPEEIETPKKEEPEDELNLAMISSVTVLILLIIIDTSLYKKRKASKLDKKDTSKSK